MVLCRFGARARQIAAGMKRPMVHSQKHPSAQDQGACSRMPCWVIHKTGSPKSEPHSSTGTPSGLHEACPETRGHCTNSQHCLGRHHYFLW